MSRPQLGEGAKVIKPEAESLESTANLQRFRTKRDFLSFVLTFFFPPRTNSKAQFGKNRS